MVYTEGTDLISIHALREEGDDIAFKHFCQSFVFLSTPSARRATDDYLVTILDILNFYPRPPRGGRRQISGQMG